MALIPTHSIKFSPVSTGVYDVIERSTGDLLGEVYQQGAAGSSMGMFKALKAKDGDWVCHSYLTGGQTVHSTRQAAGEHLRKQADAPHAKWFGCAM